MHATARGENIRGQRAERGIDPIHVGQIGNTHPMRTQQSETLRPLALSVCISAAQMPRDGVGKCLERASAPD
jgi:hypothetical protein